MKRDVIAKFFTILSEYQKGGRLESEKERMSSKNYNIKLVKIQPAERLAAISELNLAPNPVTDCCEVRGWWGGNTSDGIHSSPAVSGQNNSKEGGLCSSTRNVRSFYHFVLGDGNGIKSNRR